jgi:hypothetical protein
MIRHCPTTPWHRQAATKRRHGHQQADWGRRSGTLFAGCCVPGDRRERGALQWRQHADASHDKTASLRDWCTSEIRNYPYDGRIPHRISRWSNPVSNIEGQGDRTLTKQHLPHPLDRSLGCAACGRLAWAGNGNLPSLDAGRQEHIPGQEGCGLGRRGSPNPIAHILLAIEAIGIGKPKIDRQGSQNACR